MDEGLGFLVIVGLVIAAIVFVVIAVVTALGWTFLAASAFLGHPIVLVLALAALGGCGGMIMLHRRHGFSTARSTDDYASIGPVRLTPEGWAISVALAFGVVVSLYGMAIV
jgi:hypothetical protein